ncbi:acyltransferase family protein [Nesterenkonia populi]
MTRNVGIDLLRVISVVAVVLGHAWPFMPGEEYLQIWRMPLFFFLAGFFLSSSRGFSREASVRWRTLGVPYVTWFLVLSALVVIHGFTPRPFDQDGPWELIAGAAYGGGLTHSPYLAFWFISVLFFAVLLVRGLLHLPWWIHPPAAAAGLALAQIPDSLMSYTPLGVGLAPACAAYILAGFWVRRLLTAPWAEAAARSPFAGAVGMGLIFTGLYGVSSGYRTMNMKWSGFGDYLVSPALAVLICIGLVLIFSTWADSLLKAVPGIGGGVSQLVATGTLVVFLHPYVLFLVSDAAEFPPARAAIALAICWPLGLLVNRTRLSPWLTGLGAKKAPPLTAAQSPRE